MRKFTIAAVGFAALAAATPGGTQAAPAGGGYDILGLKLGMTAAQAEAVIAQRLHVHPGNGSGTTYNVAPKPGHYVPGRLCVDGFIARAGTAELALNFTEVARGAGQGPEALYHIEYTPAAETTADKAAFVAQVVKKFGHPAKVFDGQEDYWANRAYASPLAFDTANTPVLHLTTYSAVLILENNGISYHMESVFNGSRTKAPAPL